MFTAPILEREILLDIKATPFMGFIVALSCVLGLGMSFLSFKVRSEVTATYFAIIGNVCKVISVIINYLMWDKHASPEGLGFLALSLIAAYFYEQAPLRPELDEDAQQRADIAYDEEEAKSLVQTGR